MIVVRVELHSARTGRVTELARMHVCNEGGTKDLGDYGVTVLRGRSKEALDRGVVQRRGEFGQFPRLRVHVWNLVLYALVSSGYGAVGRANESPTPAGQDAGTKRKENADPEAGDKTTSSKKGDSLRDGPTQRPVSSP